MLKEYVVRIDHKNNDKQITEACMKICKDFDGEFYTKIVDKNYKPGLLKFMPKSKDKLLFWERGNI